MKKRRPTRETIAQRFAEHDARHPDDCPHCLGIIAQTGSLTIRPSVIVALDHLMATADRVSLDHLTDDEIMALLSADPSSNG